MATARTGNVQDVLTAAVQSGAVPGVVVAVTAGPPDTEPSDRV
jgi:hypothetical protein